MNSSPVTINPVLWKNNYFFRTMSLQSRLDRKITQLDKFNDLLDKLIESPNSRLEFDTGDGRMELTKMSFKQVSERIHILEGDIDLLERKCNGGGFVSHRLSRYGNGIGRFRRNGI